MNDVTARISTSTLTYTGPADNRLVATRIGAGRPVLLVHGGGQTRHAWDGTMRALASSGWCAIAYDQRGHGESDWVEDGDYSYTAYADDLAAVARAITDETGQRPVVIGASLGGLSGMIVAGEMKADVIGALILVDITHMPARGGVNRVFDFMSARSEQGFGSLEEAAEMIADYLPHRRKPRRLDGLSKNLRLHDDGRYRWHWDPRFLDCREMEPEFRGKFEARVTQAAAKIACPVLLVRGGKSDLVTEDAAMAFLDLVDHADYADVSDAGHMVAGDSNDLFTGKIVGFLDTLPH